MEWWMYDIIIGFFLIAVGAFLIEIAVRWKRWHHRPLMAATGLVCLVAWGTIFYGSFIEPKRLVTRMYDVAITKTPVRSLKAVIVADLHLGPYKNEAWTERVTNEIMAARPEIIFLLGDFVFNEQEVLDWLEPLGNLEAPYGVFAVTGNHEYATGNDKAVADKLTSLGIDVLRNEATTITVSRQLFTIAGVDDMQYEGNPYEALRGIDEESHVILLSHTPDVMLSPDAKRADLVVAAHTHGGQVRLPWVGPVAQIPTVLGQAYDLGLFGYEGIPLFITPGVGETGTRARLFNPPEISILSIEF